MSQLYAVRMDVALPPDMDPRARNAFLAREKAYSQRCQRPGHCRHTWRCVGQYATPAVFAAESNEQRHRILWGFPMFR